MKVVGFDGPLPTPPALKESNSLLTGLGGFTDGCVWGGTEGWEGSVRWGDFAWGGLAVMAGDPITPAGSDGSGFAPTPADGLPGCHL